MTGYGAPGTPPAAKKALPLFDLIGAGLGVLSFVWGFLPFYTGPGGFDVKGYNTGSTAIGGLALSILAGAFAGAIYLSGKPDPARPPYALAVAASALLVTFGAMVAKGTGADLGYGFYLLIVTTAAQTGVFAYSWLQLTGKISAARPAPQGWSGPPQQQPPSYGGPQYGGQPQMPPGYGQPPQAQQPPVAAPMPPQMQPPQQPPGGFGPPPQQPPSAPQYSPPPTSYAPPAAPPSYELPSYDPPSYEPPTTPPPPPGPASSFGSSATTVMPTTPPPMPPASGSGYGTPPPPPSTPRPGDSEH